MKLPGTVLRDPERASLATSHDPAENEELRKESRTESTGNVRAAFGPVGALAREGTARATQEINVNAEFAKPCAALAPQFVFPSRARAKNA